MPQTTLAQYRTAIKAKLRLSDEDEPLIDTWVNQAYEQFLLDTGCYIRPGTLTATAGVGDYSLDPRILGITEWRSGAGGTFERATAEEVLGSRNGSNTGPARAYAIQGSDVVMVWPTPSDNAQFSIYYIPRPPLLVSDGDVPTQVPGEFHKALEYWACVEGGDYDDDQTSAQGSRYLDLYQSLVLKCRQANLSKGGRRLARAVVRAPSGRPVSIGRYG